MGHIINDFHFKRLNKLKETSGGKIVFGGQTNEANKFIYPCLIRDVPDEAEIMNEEIFGPLLPIKIYKGMSEVCDYVSERPKPLAVYFFGAPYHADSKRLQAETSSGAFATNDCISQTVSHYQGFGGVGESGAGRYGGLEGFQNFSNRKGVLIKGPVAAGLRQLTVPPYTDGKSKFIERVFSYLVLYNQSDIRTLFNVLSLAFAGFIIWYFFM